MEDTLALGPPALEAIAKLRFSTLSESETKLIRFGTNGKVVLGGPNDRDDHPDNDPSQSSAWGIDRSIRAELVRWICIDQKTKDCIDPRGLRIYGARIVGKLDFSFTNVGFPIRFNRCIFSEDINLDFLEIPLLDLRGTCIQSLRADRSKVRGSIFLGRGFCAHGPVMLRGAQIGGNLDCDGGTFDYAATTNPSGGIALNLEAVNVADSILLRDKFCAKGIVRLFRSQIGGNLECDGGRFLNPAMQGIDESGLAIQAFGAKITGTVMFRSGFFADGEVRLAATEIGGRLDCDDGEFNNPPEEGIARSGIAFSIDSAKIAGSILFRKKFSSKGVVRLFVAQVGGNIECDNGTFENPAKPNLPLSGLALDANGARIGGAVLLRRGFSAEGRVQMYGIVIGGVLDCEGATFQNPAVANIPWSGVAFNADAARVNGALSFRNRFSAKGEVRFYGAQVGGNIACDGAKMENPPIKGIAGTGTALHAEALKVNGSVLLRNGFFASGEVRLFAARIEGHLDCQAGKFSNPEHLVDRVGGTALNLTGTVITGSVFFHNSFQAQGFVRLGKAQIAQRLECAKGTFEGLELTDAFAGAIIDDKDSWPTLGKLVLDGFTYERIAGGPADAATRLKWLERQGSFTRQPYRQLAKVLKDAGDDRGWRTVSVEMERKAREGHGWKARPLSYLLRETIGYGYFSARAIRWLFALVLLGTVVYQMGYIVGSLVPTQLDAYNSFANGGNLLTHYESFNALAYSVENSFPLIKLGVQEKWTPAADAELVIAEPVGRLSRILMPIASAKFLRRFRWLQIGVGWILTTLFVGGITGLSRKD